jgi:methionine-rich copper-binding protein CopC
MSLRTLSKAVAVAATSAVALAAGALAAAPAAHASTESTDAPQGEVVSSLPRNIRHLPSTDAEATGTLQPNEIVDLDCKVTGQTVDGNSIWYQLADADGWVSARYVQNLDPVEFCAWAQ